VVLGTKPRKLCACQAHSGLEMSDGTAICVQALGFELCVEFHRIWRARSVPEQRSETPAIANNTQSE